MKKLLWIPQSGIKPLLCLCFIFFSIGLFAQQVSGIIKDSEGSPIIGAAIIVKGKSNGTTTDAGGAFTLNNVAKGSTLVVSFVGFKTVEVNAER